MSRFAATLPPLELSLKPDAAEAHQRLRAYWQGQLVDRACVNIRAPKAGTQGGKRSLIVAEDFDFPAAIDRFEQWAEGMFYGGEALPVLMPNYGPDQWAGFLGAALEPGAGDGHLVGRAPAARPPRKSRRWRSIRPTAGGRRSWT